MLLGPVAILAGGWALRPRMPSLSQTTETISVRTDEGTMLSLDVSADAIVFDLLGQLWVVPRGGGAARAITDAVADTAEDQDPSWAPDGRRVVFRGERGGRTGLWLLEPPSKRPVQLVQLPDPFSYAGGAAWSPDGERIAFARVQPPDTVGGRRSSGIAVMDLATRTVRELRIDGPRDARLRSPAWTPDGRRIAFVALAPGDVRAGRGGRVWVVDTSGGVAAPLTDAGVRALAPALSPDGRRLAYLASDSAGRLQVWTRELSADGATAPGVAAPLTDHADVAPTRVRWSADGRTLFYSADGKIRRIPAGGGRATEVPFSARLVFTRPRPVRAPARFPEPGREHPARGFTGLALSPDARQIGAIALGRLWVIPVGGSPRAIADVPHTARYLTWAPDGAELAWSAGRGNEQDVFATSLTTGATRRVTALPGRELYPAFSPDGRWLAFTHADSTTHLRVIVARDSAVSDTLRARNLGPAGAEWTGSNVDVPRWSPASDALLLGGSWDVGQPTVGELVALSGERTTVTLPDAPSFFHWTRTGLVWTRHDRLWTAPFDRTGMTGVPRPLGDAPAMYPSASLDGTVLYLSEGGLRLRSPSGEERPLGWPIRFTPPVPEPLVIRNVRIIDGTGAPASAPRDLLIERGRIARIAAAGSVAAGSRRVVDAAGRFAIPGLMDLHAHVYRPDLLPGFLSFGVTLVRDQGSSMAPLVAHADAIAAGVVPGPRVSYGGFQFYSDWPFDEEQGRGVEPEADARHVARAVALADAFGAHHIKVRTFRRWDINARMIAEAHRRGMRATGHCAQPLPLVAAGIDAKEHIGVCASRGETGVYGDMVQYDDVNRLLRAADIAVVPTIVYFDFAARLNERPAMLEGDTALAPWLPPMSSFGWMLGLNREQREVHARAARQARETTAKLKRAGVTLGTGSDIWQIPTGVHMELEELVASGLSPMDAIRAATGNSARIVGVERDLGTIEVGKLADLVLLDADPLADIRNTRRIWAVVQSGRVVDRAAIAETYRGRR